MAISLWCCLPLIGQQKKLDSLLRVCNAYQYRDSLKVAYFISVTREYNRMHDGREAYRFGDSAYNLARTVGNPQLFANTCLVLAHLHHGRNEFAPALAYYNKALSTELPLDHTRHIAGLWVDLGALYMDISDYGKSLEANMKAIDYFNQAKDTLEVNSVYMNTGQTYLQMRKPLEAIAYVKKAMLIFKLGHEPSHYGLSMAYEAIGNAIQIASNEELRQLGIHPDDRDRQTLRNYSEGLRYALLDPPDQNDMAGLFYKDIGLIYQRNRDPRALKNFMQAAGILKANGSPQQLADMEYTLGNYYLQAGTYAGAGEYFARSLQLAKQSGALSVQQNVLEASSIFFEKTGRPDSALYYLKQSIIVHDSVMNAEKEKDITRKQLQLDFAIKENAYKLNEELVSNKVRQQILQISFDRKLKWLMGAGILLVIVFAGFMMYSQNQTKKLNRIISNQKSSLEQLGQVKDKLFSVVGHDLRTPVNSLVSFIDLLEQKALSPDKLQLYTAELRQQLVYTSSLMNNLLNWSASQMEGFGPLKCRFNLRTMADDVCRLQQLQFQEKGLQADILIPEGLCVFADPDMTALVLRNLLANAVKFSDPGSRIVIGGTTSGNGCTIDVTDSGKGMLPTDIASFNSTEFERVESKRGTAGEKGTGLGLLLCKTFALQMGGNIKAIPQVKGMQFRLWLPSTETSA